VRRAGLGRRTKLGGGVGDPLDGLVNLFDIGIVLAVAFLVVGLGAALERHGASKAAPSPSRLPRGAHVLSTPSGTPRVSGGGEAVGSVYRLADGRLVYVPGGGAAKPPGRR
jgi:hypothetical protein